MLNARGVIVLTSFIFVITAMVWWFSDEIRRNNPTTLCKSVTTGQIDLCARMGGLER